MAKEAKKKHKNTRGNVLLLNVKVKIHLMHLENKFKRIIAIERQKRVYKFALKLGLIYAKVNICTEV